MAVADQLTELRAAALPVAVDLAGRKPIHSRTRQGNCARWCVACHLDRLLDVLDVDDPQRAVLTTEATHVS